MSDPLLWHRIQFAFTITFHYLFPQLTMGLALLIVVLKLLALRPRRRGVQRGRPVLEPDLRPQLRDGRRDRHPDGVPVRHELGAVLAVLRRGRRRALAMEGPSRSSSSRPSWAVPLRRAAARPEAAPRGGRRPVAGQVALGLLHHRRQRLHAAPGRLPAGRGRYLHLEDFWAYLLNPWALWQYAHTMAASLVTASFVVAAVGRLLVADGPHARHAAIFLRVGVDRRAHREPPRRVPDRRRRRRRW